MSRKNEIKKDIWDILREVYSISEHREITDKQNEFLDKIISYLEENISLRRKTDKQRENEEEDSEPLLRPEPKYPVEPILKPMSTPTPKPVKTTKKMTKAEGTVQLNLSALPEHLRKYVKS